MTDVTTVEEVSSPSLSGDFGPGASVTATDEHGQCSPAAELEPVGRERFPDRRASVNADVFHEFTTGKRQRIIITCGYVKVGIDYRVREVFTAALKPGGDTNAIIADACVFVSMLMQHGYTARLLHDKVSKPNSLMGTVIAGAAQVEDLLNSQENGESGN